MNILWNVIPILVKLVFSEETVVNVCLMFVFAVHILERISIRFLFLCFKPQRISFEISFTTSCYFSVMFQFVVWTIAFLILWSMHVTCIYSATLLLVVFVLRNTRVYICSSNHSNISSYIKIPVNKAFCFCTILWISNINPYHGHIRFERCFDNSKIES